MWLWIVAAFLTFVACLAVLRPFVARPDEAATPAEHDIEVYRDQLAELDRDADRGVIAASEAEEARAEIARRIVHAGALAERDRAAAENPTPRWLIAAAVLSIPLVSWGIYATVGSPHLPSQPLVSRLEKDPTQNTVAELVARAERHLRANPEDGQGWQVLAPIYMRLGQYDQATIAYRNAIRLLGPSSAGLTNLGEAMGAAAGGVITTDAVRMFNEALVLDPENLKAQFFLAAAAAQEGRMQEAVSRWRALADGALEASPWRMAAEQAIAGAQGAAQSDAPGPTSEDVQAAQDMAVEDRQAMIEGMVASLDERLREDPGDVAGWQRLIRAYGVLGKTEDARDALTRGLSALGRDSEKGGQLLAFAATLGIDVTDDQPTTETE